MDELTKDDMLSTNWREQSPTIRENFAALIHMAIQSRMAEGEIAYPNDFEGDPGAHGLEEKIDDLYYWLYTERKVGALELEVERLTTERETYYRIAFALSEGHPLPTLRRESMQAIGQVGGLRAVWNGVAKDGYTEQRILEEISRRIDEIYQLTVLNGIETFTKPAVSET